MYVTKPTQNIRRGLSDRETMMLCSLATKGKSIIRYDDIINVTQISYQNARKMAQILCKKKWLIPVSAGKYLISPLDAGMKSEYTEHEFIIASHLAGKRPSYIAYWTALNHYGYTEQVPLVVISATTSRMPNTVVHGVRYEFVTITGTKFFGTSNLFIDNHKILISDKEKTIVDALDHPEYCGGIQEVAKCLWNARNELSFERMITYSKQAKNSTVIKRLGYLIDLFDMKIPDHLYHKMRNMIGAGYSQFNPFYVTSKKTNPKWKLYVNVPENQLFEEIDR